MRKMIIANVGSNYLLSFFGMALGFLLVPFLIHKLGADAYGLTVLAESTVAFFEILTISVRMALSRHATVALSRNEIDDFIEYLSTGRVVLYFSAAIVFVAGLFLSVNFTSLFRVPPEFAMDSRVLFFLVSLGFTISIPNIIFWSVLYARQRFDLINISSSVGLVMRAVCVFVFYSFAPKEYQTLTAYGLIYLAMTFTQNFMIYFWHKKLMPEGRRIGRAFFRRHRMREILSFSFNTSLIRASALLYQETAHIIINVFWGASYNALYSVALKLPNMMRRIFIEPSWSLTSTFTDLFARGDKPRMERLLYTYSKMMSVATFPLCIILVLFSRNIISAWVGPGFEMASGVMPYFCIPLFTSIPFALSGCLVNAAGKVKWPSIISFVSAVLNLVLCLVLGVHFGWKLYGVAWAALLCSLLNIATFHPVYACRVSGVSIGRYWIESFVKPILLTGFLMMGGYWLLKLGNFQHFMDPLLLATLSALCMACYGLSYVFLLDAYEKEFATATVRDAFKKIRRLF